jgi:hypothetical protein
MHGSPIPTTTTHSLTLSLSFSHTRAHAPPAAPPVICAGVCACSVSRYCIALIRAFVRWACHTRSLGVIVYLLLSGHLPFFHKNPAVVSNRTRNDCGKRERGVLCACINSFPKWFTTCGLVCTGDAADQARQM